MQDEEAERQCGFYFQLHGSLHPDHRGLGHWNHGAMLYSVDSEEQQRVLGGEWWLDQGCLQWSVLSL